jgi:hypothetical protein
MEEVYLIGKCNDFEGRVIASTVHNFKIRIVVYWALFD